MSVTPQFLMVGAAYALEQCGLLLRDANILYRSGSYASAMALTAFAHEELGRSRILIDLWRRVRSGEKKYTLAQVRRACNNHVNKQHAGMLIMSLAAPNDSGLGQLVRGVMENHPHTVEWQKAYAELTRITATERRRTPTKRHEKRIAALYVEPLSETEWKRPTALSGSAARQFLQNAVTDYAVVYHQRYITGADPTLKYIEPDMYAALEQWSERPELPPPEWPQPS